jgi:hypothetical protein
MNTHVLRAVIEAEIARATGRRYKIDLDGMNEESLQELLSMIRDLDHEKTIAAQRAHRQPWRRP